LSFVCECSPECHADFGCAVAAVVVLLQDEAIATLAEQLLSGCWCVSVPGLPGQPLAAVSPALEQLAGHAAADLVGSSSSKLQQALRLEQQVSCDMPFMLGKHSNVRHICDLREEQSCTQQS
jgi:putative hemolysin